jgi:hypothetical protein
MPLLVLRLFLLLDDLLELFLGFWSSSCASWGFGFELQTLCFLLSMNSWRGRLRNQVVSTLVLYVMSHWHVEVWIRIRDISVVLLYYLCSYGESCLLVSWCAGGRCNMAGSIEDHDKSRRPGTEDRGWSSTGRVLNGPTIERSGDAVWGLHRARGDEERMFFGWASKPRSGFLVEPQNQGWWFPGLGIKTGNSGLVICVAKSPRWFLGLGLKTKQATVYRLCHKTDGKMIQRGTCIEIWRLAPPGSKSR